MTGFLITLAGILLASPEPPEVPESVHLVPEFSVEAYANPDAVFWPAYFWLWNGALDEDTLRNQLRDMATHDARSVCMLPMPRGFRPDSTNNSMEPDYLTPEYFERVRVAVDEAAALGMNWWLYDEGGWPSGLALGKVVEGHPELARQRIVRDAVPADAPFTVPRDAMALVIEQPEGQVLQPGDVWNPSTDTATAYIYRVVSESSSDLLNPEATRRFLNLTHDAYAGAIAPHFGKTVRFTFTDEPGAGMPRMPDHLPWTPGLDTQWRNQTGTSFQEALPRLFAGQGKGTDPAAVHDRIALYDVLSARFADAYFGALESWGREHGLASGGHLGGEDETLGAVKYSFGHVLRPLRQMDIPGVDLIWRQIFPGSGPQSNFPVLAPTAAHQNGTRFAFSESFCVYGNGLTPAQMKWLVDYQYVRGINLMVLGCYPLSTRDHHMTGERPHFGVMNPLWDHLPGFHAYTARLGYALSVGAPAIRTALYYPVRDLWAWGAEATGAVSTYEQLQTALAALPCAYDLIDDDMLAVATVTDGFLAVGPMRYDTLVCGDVRWMAPESLKRLEAFAQAGGRVVSVDHAPATDGSEGRSDGAIVHGAIAEILKQVKPSVELSPATNDIRASLRSLSGQEIVMLFNEGGEPYQGTLATTYSHACVFNLQQGGMTEVPVDGGRLAIALNPGDSVVFLLSEEAIPGARSPRQTGESLTVAAQDLTVKRVRQWVAGPNDFERVEPPVAPTAEANPWKNWLGEDFSGEVDYETTIDIPNSWGTHPLLLETGPIEYAASVFLDGQQVGTILWSPWSVELPLCAPGKHQLVIRVANTLANELTSERVTKEWAARSGPGWPSPYHERALVFERESRGGGLSGPLRLTRLVDPPRE